MWVLEITNSGTPSFPTCVLQEHPSVLVAHPRSARTVRSHDPRRTPCFEHTMRISGRVLRTHHIITSLSWAGLLPFILRALFAYCDISRHLWRETIEGHCHCLYLKYIDYPFQAFLHSQSIVDCGACIVLQYRGLVERCAIGLCGRYE